MKGQKDCRRADKYIAHFAWPTRVNYITAYISSFEGKKAIQVGTCQYWKRKTCEELKEHKWYIGEINKFKKTMNE